MNLKGGKGTLRNAMERYSTSCLMKTSVYKIQYNACFSFYEIVKVCLVFS